MYITMSQSKAKYHRLHLNEETDGASYEKHTSKKLSIVICAALVLVFVFGLSWVIRIVIASKSLDKDGEYK